MKREIKFRYWDKETNSMVNDTDYVKTDEEVLEYEYMQFTGLKDKNGLYIYEGDIVRYKSYSNMRYDYEYLVSTVVFGETGDSDDYCHNKHYEYIVGGDSLADVADGSYDGFDCEVIGNIYENKELLE